MLDETSLLADLYAGVGGADFERHLCDVFSHYTDSLTVTHRISELDGRIIAETNAGAERLRSYEEHYSQLNPIMPVAAPILFGPGFCHVGACINLDSYQKTEFYRDWIIPMHGHLDEVAYTTRLGIHSVGYLALSYPADYGPIGIELVRRLERLANSVRHASNLHLRLTSVEVNREFAGRIVVSREGKVLHYHGELARDLLNRLDSATLFNKTLRRASAMLEATEQVPPN